MLSKTDERYLTQGTMQKLICLLGSKCFCDKLANTIDYEPAMDAAKYLVHAVQDIDKAYEIFVDNVDISQIERLKRFNESHRLALVPAFDPLVQKTPMVMEWQHVRTLVEAINSEICTLCDKDKDGVRKCELRKAIYQMGGEPDAGKAMINQWCEISRGIL